MERYTIFTKDELWDMLDGKAIVTKSPDGINHTYVSTEGYDNLRYADGDREEMNDERNLI